jgi:hypothetical protein
MTVSKPSVLPQWAIDDQVDPVSMQNNVLTPPPAFQMYGWLRSQFPPRQWFNWLGRLTYNALAWLFQQEAQAIVATDSGSGAVVFNVTTGGLCTLWVVDTGSGGGSNFYNGIAYVPPSPGSPVAMNKIANGTLTISSISTSGGVTVSGGVGPYLLWGQTKTVPS